LNPGVLILGSFHCLLFCHGFEEARDDNVGGLLIANGSRLQEVDNAISLGQPAFQFTRDLTVFLNGNTNLSGHPKIHLAQSRGIKINPKAIARMETSPEGAAVTLVFEDDTRQTVDFLVHKAETKVFGTFAQELGLKFTAAGDVETTAPCQETSVKGIFAAGDCGTPAKLVVVAMATGASVGIGANAQLLAEDASKPWW
jgi:NADPH-dependent glutamate synthase beta subunit-like oxidoreductase